MKRTAINALVDGIALVGFVLLASTGLVLSYQLPPGSGGREMLGAGRGASEKLVVVLWGLTRHEWGEIHYWLSMAVMAVLAVHLVLHWKWIVCLFKPAMHGQYSGKRLAVGAVGAVALCVLALAPYATSTVELPRGALQSADPSEAPTDDELGIRGRMTLAEISRATEVPLDYLMSELGLPANTPPDAQAGRLLRQVGLEMQDLREAVTRYQESSESVRTN
jgi:Domain of unknown function (DUF4405)